MFYFVINKTNSSSSFCLPNITSVFQDFIVDSELLYREHTCITCPHPPPPAHPAAVGKALYKMLVVQAFRGDRLTAVATLFVATVLGESFLQYSEQELDLSSIVMQEVRRTVAYIYIYTCVCGCHEIRESKVCVLGSLC